MKLRRLINEYVRCIIERGIFSNARVHVCVYVLTRRIISERINKKKKRKERKDKKIKWKMGYYTPREIGETREGISRRRLESITFNLTKERLPLP